MEANPQSSNQIPIQKVHPPPQGKKYLLLIIGASILILAIIIAVISITNQTKSNQELQDSSVIVHSQDNPLFKTFDDKVALADSDEIHKADSREYQLELANQVLNWTDQQRDDRDIYSDQILCNYTGGDIQECINFESNRAFLPALWARYQNYLTTGNQKQLAILKNDIQTARTTIIDDDQFVIQNNFYDCAFMQDMLDDNNDVLTEYEKESLRLFCTESIYELFYDSSHPYANLNENEFDTIIRNINNKVVAVNNNQAESYQLNQDPTFIAFYYSVVAPDSSLGSPAEQAEMVRGRLANISSDVYDYFLNDLVAANFSYFYTAQDLIARYQIEPTTKNLRAALITIDQALVLYVASQQANFLVGNLDCFAGRILEQANLVFNQSINTLTLNWRNDNNDSATGLFVKYYQSEAEELTQVQRKIARSLMLNGGYTDTNSLFMPGSAIADNEQMMTDVKSNSLYAGLLSIGQRLEETN